MPWLICIFTAVFLALHPAVALVPLYHRKIKLNCSTLNVDQSGWGRSFRTIQSAIESVPQNNKKWVCINIKEGTYRERIYIPYGKPYIYLIGAGMKKTFVQSDGHDPLDQTATLISLADNIIAEGISFSNTWWTPMKPAAAAKIEGDKSAFYGCGFYGLQDTVWDSKGRHYFKQCTIEGAVDFIFGSGQSIYEKCALSVIAQNLGGVAGFITAQAREHPEETNGFVFKNCYIKGKGKTYLGRPWRPYARVIFYKTHMDDIIVPKGWTADSNQQLLTFEEVGCKGPGSYTGKRVRWADKLGYNDLKQFINLSYVNGDGWIQPQMIDSE